MASNSVTLKHVPGKNAGHIVIYALSTCPWCQKTKKLFGELGLEYYYEDVDLLAADQQRDAMSEVQRWNPGRSFPTIVINDHEAMVGFDEAGIRGLVKV
jgi:glutaredoxin-like protein NrdH